MTEMSPQQSLHPPFWGPRFWSNAKGHFDLYATSSTGAGEAEVRTVVMPADSSQQPIKINYLLRQAGGDWKVYDVTAISDQSTMSLVE